ncbi:MAG: hypothetical protein K2H60_00425 [Muribaculaceae bacterium]|nr:hypothetical protein [Muribaculaceae bacterium]
MKIIIGVGIALIAGVAAYLWYNSKKKKVTKKVDIPTEFVDSLALSDMVQYFRSLSLEEGKNRPFICTDREMMAEFINLPDIADNVNPLLLGVYTDATDALEPLKLVCVKEIGSDIKEVMGNDKLVMLT